MMNKATGKEKIKIGITIGDFNGVGPELILKTFDDLEILNSFIRTKRKKPPKNLKINQLIKISS